ncbi:uncharacterized protein FA14DRAFT_23514 [Meira miltonrushii]|uniref:Secreted protein n=1 Tax=Meira miltonrushii TaxID=1280837 RepID=A0A316VLK5_9BASI|nr:uncharacterized protein FA14DRAFT_23514 [Meira miltonrushii]PWN38154.1 hypothetical protein FA14DRAFT_23514 [Meira miltonrushii]
MFLLKFIFIALLVSMQLAMVAFCSGSDSESESGTLVRIHRHPQLQRMVREHHLRTAEAHASKGLDLAMDALGRGIERSAHLNTHAVLGVCGGGYFGDAAHKIARARRTSMAAIAGCFNASATGGTNAVKHLYKSVTQPKKVQTDDQHFERVRHDNRHLRQAYHGISDQIQYISEHH